MTPRYTANTNFRSHKPKNGYTRFLAEPGFTEKWLHEYVAGKLYRHSVRPYPYPGDIIKLLVRVTRSENIEFYGVMISNEPRWVFRFYNTKEEAVNQRILRDLQERERKSEKWYTYVIRLDMADFRPKPIPPVTYKSLLK